MLHNNLILPPSWISYPHINEKAKDSFMWCGQNLLGFALMEGKIRLWRCAIFCIRDRIGNSHCK